MALLLGQRDLVPLLIWKEEFGCGVTDREHLVRLHRSARATPKATSTCQAWSQFPDPARLVHGRVQGRRGP